MPVDRARSALLGPGQERSDLMFDASADPFAALRKESLMETLAALEHERWSHWQRYMHAQCHRADDGSLTIPAELVTRWEKQTSTAYSELSEAEKESDREQVRRYLSVIAAALADGG
jgi:Zn-dependent M32 family carboxypeptidase